MSLKKAAPGKAVSVAERSKFDVAAAEVIKSKKPKTTSRAPVFLSDELERDMTVLIHAYLKSRIARPMETIGYAEVARRFGVCQNTIRNWINKPGPVTLPAPSAVFPGSERVGWNDKLIDAIQARLIAEAHGLDWTMLSDLQSGFDKVGSARPVETSEPSISVMSMIASSLSSTHVASCADSAQTSAHVQANAAPTDSSDDKHVDIIADASTPEIERNPMHTALSAPTDEPPYEQKIHALPGLNPPDGRASEAAETGERAIINCARVQIQLHPALTEMSTRQTLVEVPTRQNLIRICTRPSWR